jgi:hypothetical protein
MPFRQALAKDDQEAFDRMFEYAKSRLQAEVHLARPWGFEEVFMALVLEHEMRVGEIVKRLEELGGASDVSGDVLRLWIREITVDDGNRFGALAARTRKTPSTSRYRELLRRSFTAAPGLERLLAGPQMLVGELSLEPSRLVVLPSRDPKYSPRDRPAGLPALSPLRCS